MICLVFSLPFTFNYFDYIGNTFPNIIFNDVRSLQVQDQVPFEHEFFIRIASSFPILEQLSVVNLVPQSKIRTKFNYDNNQLYPIVKYPYLVSLSLYIAHNDYIEQFLNDKKTYLPSLTKLTVAYDKLQLMTENFTRDTTRLNCINVNELNTIETTIVHSKDFYIYFSLL
ncbi:unnamed protein product [Rotaria sp. Silwood1]|nr:unnamed protein product [Rotaria sp. Silwood1]